MYAYCQVHGIKGKDYHHFKDVVKAMDDAYLEHIAKEINRKTDTGGAGSG